MEVYKEFIVFIVDYKTKIAFVSTKDPKRSWTIEADRSFPLNELKPKLFLESGNDVITKVYETQDWSLNNIAVSEAHNLLAFATGDKSVYLGEIKDSSFNLLSRRSYLRTVSVLKFSSCGKFLFLADKTGDVFEYSCVDINQPARWIFGHISQILDLQISPDLRFIVTTDRDEKIRITNYPTTHEIEVFCIGHTEFVSSAVFINNDKFLLSASGDKTIKVWDFEKGKQLQSIALEYVPNEIVTSKDNGKKGVLAISSDDNVIYIYRYSIHSEVIKVNMIGQKSFSSEFDFALQDETFFIKHVHEVDGEKRLLLDKALLTDFAIKFELFYDLTTILDTKLEPSYRIIKPYETSLLFKKNFNNVDVYLDRKRARLEKTQGSMDSK